MYRNYVTVLSWNWRCVGLVNISGRALCEDIISSVWWRYVGLVNISDRALCEDIISSVWWRYVGLVNISDSALSEDIISSVWWRWESCWNYLALILKIFVPQHSLFLEHYGYWDAGWKFLYLIWVLVYWKSIWNMDIVI
jgi:hypothetical protein